MSVRRPPSKKFDQSPVPYLQVAQISVAKMNIESEVTSRIQDDLDDEIDPMESIPERDDFDFETESKVSDFQYQASFGRGELNPPIAL